ncbi:Peptidoglycan/xylan/chitin deacetylase, PgdA/CDA1 family [Marinactinospora thermotolerans DSM 45154]|uniref:Peptidoglycan/xylan/chitin deacetylase, PgdA/CDA1 family n=1 Tax=Marinactinospora thermotolerans DSM 45154 TaxID=1122192 RepID=A0A1T4M4B7_9ACTN|nr:Peptidoglycan/xylan/chitin deacetylase, PgdA/CDA1 family [Marinactinospora thermotolerans DSM 45154]
MRGVAAASAAVLLAGACSSGSEAEHASGTQEDPREPATGEPGELTVVDPALVVDLGEEKSSEDDGVAVEVAYPTVPNAAPLTEHLAAATAQEVDDFRAANPGAKSIGIDWGVTVAGDDVVGIRLVQDEEDSEGPRTLYSTHWYDAANGRPAYSTQLIAGQEELDALNDIVQENLSASDDVDVSALHPILRLYDSMGFNADGDLVVEFDEGQVAPPEDGRVFTVVRKDDVEPLLSDFGRRAQAAATVVTPDFRIERPAPSPSADPAPSAVPGVLPARDDSVDCSAPDSKCVALTFDDGPGERTPELLDALAEHDARATFFLTGGPVREHPTTVRRQYAEGHEVANHTVTHPDLTTVSSGKVTSELATVNALIRRETGYDVDLMRPPYGATNDSVAEVSKELGLAEIIWSVDTNDWKDRNADIVAKRAVENVQPGSIILMHDIHSTTVDAVPEILKRLEEQGYTMVTVSQLLGDTEAGKSYFDGHPEPEEQEEAPDPSASPDA